MSSQDANVVDRYARALLGAARRTGATQRIFDELQVLLPLSQPNAKLRRFLMAPNISHEEKEEFLSRTVKGLLDPIVYQLLVLMLRKDRIEYTREVLQRFRLLVELEQGIREGRIASAIALSAADKAAVQRSLETFTKTRLKLDFVVDPNLVGGVRFISGDLLIDDSVRGKLQKLRQHLESVSDN